MGTGGIERMSVPDWCEGRCLSCKFYGSGHDGGYCRNKERYEEWKKNTDPESEHWINFNTFFSPRFDGIGCEYYEYD